MLSDQCVAIVTNNHCCGNTSIPTDNPMDGTLKCRFSVVSIRGMTPSPYLIHIRIKSEQVGGVAALCNRYAGMS